ncbi:MAG: hypothetical protein WC523_03865 [Patescibacteria group bacterium]
MKEEVGSCYRIFFRPTSEVKNATVEAKWDCIFDRWSPFIRLYDPEDIYCSYWALNQQTARFIYKYWAGKDKSKVALQIRTINFLRYLKELISKKFKSKE